MIWNPLCFNGIDFVLVPSAMTGNANKHFDFKTLVTLYSLHLLPFLPFRISFSEFCGQLVMQ